MVPPKGYVHPDPPKQVADGVWEDSRGNVYKYAASNDSIVCVTHSEGKEELTDEDIEKAMKIVSTPIDESQFELVDYICERYGDEKAILFRGIDIYGCLMGIFGGDESHQLILPLIAPDEIKKMYEYGLAANKRKIDHLAKKNVLIAMQGKDFGMNTGTIMSPDTIRDIYMPFAKMVNDEISKNGMYPFFHCCGKIWDILDDMVAAGYKGYQSIQESAGMDTRKVKEKYGKDLTLWTGVQCETLVMGTMEDVEKEVTENLKFLMPGGGFIFGSTNSVQYGAKTDNYLKALEIVREKGVYR